MFRHRIAPNVFRNAAIGLSVQNAHLRESLLPDRRHEPKFASGSKRESSLNELHSPLDCHIAVDRQQNVEMIGHDDEFMETKFSLRTIVAENLNE